ncbi:HAMP domain-containing histidine kinase [Hwanghaeella grinnelliae]|uniref:histidine kinase n=1 Tax=Hwanghaeella grinnelliae TaxID=2500179 RepID=A0A3S2VQX4_9PROT|nr:HAMP domain-containing sensor histidine kinase [Hwanghaeella grinnelliae]RVU38258.1 HAMP domain-containing histidine kinase [Hwanghaeella grinnelliae]
MINRHLSLIFSILTALFLTLSAASIVYSLTTLKQVSIKNYDSSGLAAIQLRMHFNLLLAELRAHEEGTVPGAARDAMLQYDIVYQRLQSLPKRPPYTEILTEEELSLLATISRQVQSEADLFDVAAMKNTPLPMGIHSRLQGFVKDMNYLVGRIVQLAQQYREKRRLEVIQSTRLLIASTGGLAITGAIFAYLLWRSRLRLHVQKLAIEESRDRLIQASDSKSQFLAHMSHEFRTPLNAILGYSEIIKLRVFGGNVDNRYLEYAGLIKQAGDHLLEIVNDVLDISKVEAGKYELNPTLFPLADVIQECSRMAGPEHATNDEIISIEIPGNCAQLHADLQAFRQIMVNLIHNAVKYSNNGGKVVVTARKDEAGETFIVVRDSGPGIAPNELAKVMQPFGQGQNNLETAQKGTGLGLSLSKKLMELHHGDLKIDSVLGKGTTVTLCFPEAA